MLLRRVCINLQTLCVLLGEVGRTRCVGAYGACARPREAWPQGFFMPKRRGLSLPLVGCALALKNVLWVCGCSSVTTPANVRSHGQSVVPEHAHTCALTRWGGLKTVPVYLMGHCLDDCLRYSEGRLCRTRRHLAIPFLV